MRQWGRLAILIAHSKCIIKAATALKPATNPEMILLEHVISRNICFIILFLRSIEVVLLHSLSLYRLRRRWVLKCNSCDINAREPAHR